LAAARNMHERKSKPFDQPRLNAVIATRRDVTSRSLHHFAQCFSFVGCRPFHITFPFSLLWILTQWWQDRGIRLVYRIRIFAPARRGEHQVRINIFLFFAAFASLRHRSEHALREISESFDSGSAALGPS